MVTDVEDLIDWFKAVLDDEEREILKHPDDPDYEWDGYTATMEQGYPCAPILAVGKKWALADITAKRRILDEFSWEGAETRAVMLLARQYAHHDGFRDEWRVEQR